MRKLTGSLTLLISLCLLIPAQSLAATVDAFQKAPGS